ncbi:outer membrane beta-barrel protein [Fortiea contorta]|uniref:outer membrane beta-barrel protein n=1 Tax=Fortiea contorta TaxID=1892405 RepID=UPI0003449713|nr:outer membrane beta-barrel protein [Fortiea contorta]
MRIYPIALCSLATLLTWDLDQNAVANSIPEVPLIGENLAENTTTVAETPTATIAAPEIIIETFGESTKSSKGAVFAQIPGSPIPSINPLTLPATDTNQQIDPQDVENELGEIDIIPTRPVKQPPQRRQPDVQLLLRSSIFSSSNVTGLEIPQPSDTLFINNATLLATPKLGEDTRLIAAAGGGLVRYGDRGDFNYNYLNFNVGLQQRLTKEMYGQLGWYQERLYRNGSGDRLLLDDSLRLSIGRQDQLNSRLRLDSFYELRASFATPSEQNRVANTLGARLRYDITPQLQGALDYRLTFKDFTQQDRFDTQNQIGLEAIYNINPDLFVGGSASYLFGSSSASSVDLNNFSVGVSVGLNVSLF